MPVAQYSLGSSGKASSSLKTSRLHSVRLFAKLILSADTSRRLAATSSSSITVVMLLKLLLLYFWSSRSLLGRMQSWRWLPDSSSGRFLQRQPLWTNEVYGSHRILFLPGAGDWGQCLSSQHAGDARGKNTTLQPPWWARLFSTVEDAQRRWTAAITATATPSSWTRKVLPGSNLPSWTSQDTTFP